MLYKPYIPRLLPILQIHKEIQESLVLKISFHCKIYTIRSIRLTMKVVRVCKEIDEL
jgi:hypothetical protein